MSLEEELRQAEAQNDRLNTALEVEVRTRRSLADSLAYTYTQLDDMRVHYEAMRKAYIGAMTEADALRGRLNAAGDALEKALPILRYHVYEPWRSEMDRQTDEAAETVQRALEIVGRVK